MHRGSVFHSSLKDAAASCALTVSDKLPPKGDKAAQGEWHDSISFCAGASFVTGMAAGIRKCNVGNTVLSMQSNYLLQACGYTAVYFF